MSQLINTTVGAGKSMLGDSEETKAMGCAAGCLSMSFELHLVGSLTLGFMLVLPEFLVADTFLNSFPFAVGIIIAFALYDLVFLMWHPRYVRGSGWLVTSCVQTGSHALSSLSLSSSLLSPSGLVIWFWRVWTCATKTANAVESKSEAARSLPCGVTTLVVLMTWSGTGVLVITLPIILAINFAFAIDFVHTGEAAVSECCAMIYYYCTCYCSTRFVAHLSSMCIASPSPTLSEESLAGVGRVARARARCGSGHHVCGAARNLHGALLCEAVG